MEHQNYWLPALLVLGAVFCLTPATAKPLQNRAYPQVEQNVLSSEVTPGAESHGNAALPQRKADDASVHPPQLKTAGQTAAPATAPIPQEPAIRADVQTVPAGAGHPSVSMTGARNLVLPVTVPQTAVWQATPGQTFISLCYHDVQDADPDQTYVGVTTSKLIEQFSWFRDNGFTPISIDDILAARAGIRPLPQNAVLLTFDDGYVSFYTKVFPLLKSYHYPAVLGVVNSWMDGGGNAGDGGTVDYAGVKMPRSAFLNWNQAREMVQSGLVEIASHTYGSHRGIVANPQGNLEPAVVSHGYNKAEQRYESDVEYQQRLRADFKASAQRITKETGRAPRVMVWPYGQYNQFAVDAAAETGMTITLTLDDGLATVRDLTAVPRYLINADPDLQGFVVEMRDLRQAPPLRAVTVDLDLVYSDDPEQELKNLDAVISRVYAMHVSTVLLKGYAGSIDKDTVRAVYFPNRHLPVRRDLMNRVAWQLATRTNVKVYAVMPVLTYDFGTHAPTVLGWSRARNRAEVPTVMPQRLSPYDPASRALIHDLYEDLGRAVPLDGVVFEDDARLSAAEDVSAPAQAAYAATGLPLSVADIEADSEVAQRWTRLKTETLINLTHDLVNAVRKYRAPLVTVRKIYPDVAFNSVRDANYAQDYGLFLQNYDYAAVLAMPTMQNVATDDAPQWLRKLVNAVGRYPQGAQRSVFLLQTVDWEQPEQSAQRFIPAETIAAQMRVLARSGAMNFGYLPDDFLHDRPKESVVHGEFSLQTYPYRP